MKYSQVYGKALLDYKKTGRINDRDIDILTSDVEGCFHFIVDLIVIMESELDIDGVLHPLVDRIKESDVYRKKMMDYINGVYNRDVMDMEYNDWTLKKHIEEMILDYERDMK